MSDEKVLTKEIAEQFLADEDSVDLSEFTAIEDEAAETLTTYQDGLCLDGLTSLSAKAAICLSRTQGPLSLDVTEVPEQACMILRDHPSFQINESDLDSWLLEELEFDWDNEGQAWLPAAIYDALLTVADKYTCRDSDSDHEWLMLDCYTPFSEGIALVQQAGSRQIHLCSLHDDRETILVFFGSISQAQARITRVIKPKD